MAHRAFEGGRQLIVFELGNGIVFVVVAPGTADRKSEETRGGGAEHLVDLIVALGHKIFSRLNQVLDPRHEESGCHMRFGVGWFQLISG